MNHLPSLYTKKAAAEALGISVRLLEMMIQRGDLAHVKIGSRTLIDPADVREFIQKQRIISPRKRIDSSEG